MQRVFLSTDGSVRPIFRSLLFVLLGVALSLSLRDIVLRLGRNLSEGILLGVLSSLLDLVWLLATWFFLRLFDRRSFRALGLWFYRGWGRELALGVGFGGGLILVVVGLLVATRGISYEGFRGGGVHTLLGILGNGGVLALAAAYEEIAFRGYAFQRLVDAIGPLSAVAICSALFGALHLMNPAATPFSTANTALAGVLLAVAYLKTRALWLPIGLHWAWNFTMGPVLSLPVSGVWFRPTLLAAKFTGSEWLTGALYGPEGGAVVTVACVLAIIWLARRSHLTPSPAMEEVLK